MVNQKRFIEVTRKWQKMAALTRKRISSSSHIEGKPSSLARKGHFVVLTLDGRNFMVPLADLKSSIFMEFLRMSEEEFGLPSDGSIMMPCDATLMEYVISLLTRRVSQDVEKAFFFHCYSKVLFSRLHKSARKLPAAIALLWLLNKLSSFELHFL